MSDEIQDADKQHDVVGVSDATSLDGLVDSAASADLSLGAAAEGDVDAANAGDSAVVDDELGEEEVLQETGSADEDVEPLELDLETEPEGEDENRKQWYILKVQVNREDSIRQALQRR